MLTEYRAWAGRPVPKFSLAHWMPTVSPVHDVAGQKHETKASSTQMILSVVDCQLWYSALKEPLTSADELVSALVGDAENRPDVANGNLLPG